MDLSPSQQEWLDAELAEPRHRAGIDREGPITAHAVVGDRVWFLVEGPDGIATYYATLPLSDEDRAAEGARLSLLDSEQLAEAERQQAEREAEVRANFDTQVRESIARQWGMTPDELAKRLTPA